jgi:hypothetical protein
MKKEQYKFLFKVPNTPRGRSFITEFKNVLNTESYSLRIRGRHSDRQSIKCYRGTEVPISKAKYLAVYLMSKLSGDRVVTSIDDAAHSFGDMYVFNHTSKRWERK